MSLFGAGDHMPLFGAQVHAMASDLEFIYNMYIFIHSQKCANIWECLGNINIFSKYLRNVWEKL